MATIAALERRLLRGLDPETQDTRHDDLWVSLLAEYMALVDQERQTCLRPERKRAVGQVMMEGAR